MLNHVHDNSQVYVKSFTKLERFIGGMKLAIVLILIFTVAMIAGTFIESYYGTEFAGENCLQNDTFYAPSVLYELQYNLRSLLETPPEKTTLWFLHYSRWSNLNHWWFSVNYIGGIDGNITLASSFPKRDVKLSEDLFKVTNLETSRSYNF